ncbi:MAG: DUF1127 domain-containing protein [Hyphomicrobiales bacterium]|nr:DUF1127 domain-containing protein [Hyphomicrobiales bacterium]
MTSLEHTALPMNASSRPAIFARALQRFFAFARALKNRRQIYRLGAMTDIELADIGLTRSDLHVAVRSPLGIDPTARLGSIASAREDAARLTC